MEFMEVKYYVVEVSRWRIAESAEDEEEAYTKRSQLQEAADEWNYDHPHKEPRYYEVMSVSEYYHGY